MNHQLHITDHNYLLHDKKISKNERKILWVIILTFLTMLVEVFFGYWTGSMALLSDGWHMASHTGALGISYLAYRAARSPKLVEKFSFGTGKFVPLGGYTSSLMLGIVAIFMMIESFDRFLDPVEINFDYAIFVSILGFVINLLSAFILWDSNKTDGNDDDEIQIHDHNHNSAFVHVIADMLTSVAAIIALVFGKCFNWTWADPLIGILASIIILKWAYGLAKVTIWELLDGHSKSLDKQSIEELFIKYDNIQISDIHIWRIAPNATACEVVFCAEEIKGANFYRDIILNQLKIEHLVVEERHCY